MSSTSGTSGPASSSCTRFEQVRSHLLTDRPLSDNRRMLIGSYFTQEYALESAALFNPSMVWHPDQSGLPEGSRRFILSLRATGEGHISSITFRSGVIDAESQIHMDEPTRFVDRPRPGPERALRQEPVPPQAVRAGHGNGPLPTRCCALVNDQFTLDELSPRRPHRPAPEPPPPARVRADRHSMLTVWPRPTTRSASRPTRRLGADHLPVVAHRDQRDRGRPVRPLHGRRRPDRLLRDLHRLRRPRDPAADARDRGLPPLQGQHPERPGGAEQGLRACSRA